MMEQIASDKAEISDRWTSLEKDTESIRTERGAVEKEKVSVLSSIIICLSLLFHNISSPILIFQEELSRERTLLQNEIALFEQRKISSLEELNYAEDRISMAQQVDAKLQEELDRLLKLSEFVARKDAEANEKLAEASGLYQKAQKLEAVLISDAEVIEHERQQLENERALLVQQRVSVLKERSMNRDMDRSVKSKMHAPARDSDVVERLASIKANLNRLRSTRE